MRTVAAIVVILILLTILWLLVTGPAEKPKECVLSLCDCKCYLKGQTPEELEGKACETNCSEEYGVTGCKLENNTCVEIIEKECETDEDCIPEEPLIGISYVCEDGVCKTEALGNPASKYCEDQGFTLESRTKPEGAYSACIFPDGTECDQWEFYRGECIYPEGSVCGKIEVCEDCGEITFEQIQQGWYWGACDQKLKYTPGDWTHVLEGTKSATWIRPTSEKWMTLKNVTCDCG